MYSFTISFDFIVQIYKITSENTLAVITSIQKRNYCDCVLVANMRAILILFSFFVYQ
jgi:hypothetical protein